MRANKQFALTLGTALGTAMAMYALAPWYAATITIAVVVAHEFGHWWAANGRGGEPDLPIFIPLAVFLVGVTRVRLFPEMDPESRRKVLQAGPLAGAAAVFALLPFTALFQTVPWVLTCILALAWEVFSITLGSDGRRARKDANVPRRRTSHRRTSSRTAETISGRTTVS